MHKDLLKLGAKYGISTDGHEPRTVYEYVGCEFGCYRFIVLVRTLKRYHNVGYVNFSQSDLEDFNYVRE